MRVLLDENLPQDFRGLLTGHPVETVAGRGWAGVRNGELLKRPSGEFDAFLTMDRRLPDQQRVAEYPFGVVLLVAPSNRLVHLEALVPELLRVLPQVKGGELRIVGA